LILRLLFRTHPFCSGISDRFMINQEKNEDMDKKRQSKQYKKKRLILSNKDNSVPYSVKRIYKNVENV